MQKFNDKRPVALLDIDLTLLCADKNRQDSYNLALLDGLKRHDIKDVYLFTDMKFGSGDIEARKKIIALLEDQGFIVHGCITPLDYFWNFDQQETLNKLVDEFLQSDISIREGAQKNLCKIPNLISKYPAIVDWINKATYPMICQAYEEAKNHYETQSEALRVKSFHCKIALDLVTFNMKFSMSKSIMFKQFLQHKPDWISECFVFDDMIECLDAVNEVTLPEFPVHTIHGIFNEHGDTFVNRLSYTIKMKTILNDIVVVSFRNIKQQQCQKDRKLLNTLFKKEGEQQNQNAQAQALLDQVLSCENDFDKKWPIFLEYFAKISKDLFGYQFTDFDTEILNGIVADKDLCIKLNIAAHRNHDDLLRQLLATMKKPTAAMKSLHASVELDLRLSRTRSSSFGVRKRKPMSAEASKPAEILVESLPKSNSTGALSGEYSNGFK